MKNKNEYFADEQEKQGFINLNDFNNHYLHIQELGKTPKKTHYDASGFTTDGRPIEIEYKIRNQVLINPNTISGHSKDNASYIASTIYIETHKVGSLMLDYLIYKTIPLYVNFLQDDTVVVFNLSMLKTRPKTVIKKIWSTLYNAFELSKREELKLDDAYIYKKQDDNKYVLIKKPQ